MSLRYVVQVEPTYNSSSPADDEPEKDEQMGDVDESEEKQKSETFGENDEDLVG